MHVHTLGKVRTATGNTRKIIFWNRSQSLAEFLARLRLFQGEGKRPMNTSDYVAESKSRLFPQYS
jgi:hypothetical protein